MTRAVLPFVFLVLVATAAADEPLWTAEERTGQRDAVIHGTVLKITKLKAINEYEDLMSADIRFDRVLKASDALPKGVVTVFYQTSPRGARYRCPTYPVLTQNLAATFYLRHHDYLTKKKDFIVELGSDVAETK